MSLTRLLTATASVTLSGLLFCPSIAAFAGQATANATSSTPSPVTTTSAAPPSSAASTPPVKRSRRHFFSSSKTTPAPAPATPQPDITAEQRARDQKILDLQKEQSAAIARDQDAVDKKLIHDQQQVQSEPRIQDAPGPGSQPLPGDPAIQPTAPSDPPRIQDAPGPAQTLPKPPPTQ